MLEIFSEMDIGLVEGIGDQIQLDDECTVAVSVTLNSKFAYLL